MNKTFNTINFLLLEIFNDIMKIEATALKNGSFSDISITEMHTIEAIGMYTQKAMGDIAKKLGITVGTLTVAINNLVKKDYVARNRCEADRRVVKISLTRKGRVLFRLHQKFHNDMVQEVIDGLTPEEENILEQALAKLNKFLVVQYNLGN